MNSQQRISLALQHKEADRVAIHDTLWATTVRRWQKEGLPKDITPQEYFDYEIVEIGSDTSFMIPEELIEETEEYKIVRNSNGALVKNWKNRTSTPEYIEFLIKDEAKWLEMKPLLDWKPDRINLDNAILNYKNSRKKGKFICYSSPMGYDKTQGFVGTVQLLMAMKDNPKWTKDMFDKSAEMIIEACEEMISKGIRFDGAFIFDDLGYRNGTFFSPSLYKELLFPSHKKVNDFMKSMGIKTILHSCGNISEIIPLLISAGWDCLNPIEVKAGMDLITLKKKYGEVLSFMGGIDVRKMKEKKSVIEKEIKEKINLKKKNGGYIYHSDHSVPDNVSFSKYKRVISLVLKYGKY